ncbi:MAG: type II toxin-antitoxin system RelE/ParE family toxin [Gammaproteobacteria bacterium]|nr:type II toxin-antitoxin system RelE/ParE family toxin [Gammaproteobacteria bacterium]
MDIEIEWSPEATEDLVSIADYIARDSEFYAIAVVTEILTTARSIPGFPLIGRIVPEIGDEKIRERFIYSYRLVYRIEATRILVVAVIHGKRLLEDISGRIMD